jgi:hypothetical protein
MTMTSHTTDYDLPIEWEGMSDEEKCRWLTQERCRRQSKRMGTQLQEEFDDMEERRDRKVEADPGMVNLKDNR